MKPLRSYCIVWGGRNDLLIHISNYLEIKVMAPLMSLLYCHVVSVSVDQL